MLLIKFGLLEKKFENTRYKMTFLTFSGFTFISLIALIKNPCAGLPTITASQSAAYCGWKKNKSQFHNLSIFWSQHLFLISFVHTPLHMHYIAVSCSAWISDYILIFLGKMVGKTEDTSNQQERGTALPAITCTGVRPRNPGTSKPSCPGKSIRCLMKSSGGGCYIATKWVTNFISCMRFKASNMFDLQNCTGWLIFTKNSKVSFHL